MSITISVITPCLNQAKYLPACLTSVAEQSHPATEHLIFDPGSTDGSRELAAAAPLATVIAETDRGQADAVTRGFARATGDVLAWLNADDRYIDGSVFERIAARFERPDQPDVVYGRGHYERPDGTALGDAFVFDQPAELTTSLKTGVGLLQPAVFVHRRALDSLNVKGPQQGLSFAMDYDLWIRLAKRGARFAFIDEPLAVAVVHPDSKTQSRRADSIQEAIDVAQSHFGFVSWYWALRQADWQVTGDAGLMQRVVDDAEQTDRINTRAQELFLTYNRNLSTVLKLVRPPWDRPALSTLSHLVRRPAKA